MKTALITGCSGYLGSHLAKTLKKSNWKVVGLDKKHTTNRHIDLFFACDVTDNNSLSIIFEKVKFDVVFHLAGRIEVGESIEKPVEFFHNNVTGTINVLNNMKKYEVSNIVYSSTAGVYASKDTPIRETDEVSPFNNPYASSKYAAEMAIRNSGLNHVIFRYFNLAGADSENEFGENHEPETHLIPRILQNLNRFEIYGSDYDTPDGTCIRDYVHVEDVAEAHLSAANYLFNKNPSKIFNLGTGTGHSVKEIIGKLSEVIEKPVSYFYLPRRQGDPPRLVANINLAKQLLNYQPKHDIISILQTANAWQNRDE